MVTTDFQALIDSLGEHLVGVLGSVGVTGVTIVANESLNTADVCIGLEEDSWDARHASFEQVSYVHALFVSELDVQFDFGPFEKLVHPVETPTGERLYAYAA